MENSDEGTNVDELQKEGQEQHNIQESCDKKTEVRKTSSALLAKTLLDVIEFKPSLFGIGLNLNALFQKREHVKENKDEYNIIISSKEEYKKNIEEKKIDIIKQLLESDIDPQLFDILIQNEVDRRLKVRFGVTFLVLTFLFTTASYAIVICNGIFKWNISEAAIAALMIETPIQFIGLLYIIARNLFPQTGSNASNSRV